MAKSSIVPDPLEPGGFYLSTQPGGFTDSLTGIHIPGPKVDVNEDTRSIDGIFSLPDPVQIPHKKLIFDYKDKERKIRESKEVPFDLQDHDPLHDGLSLASQTGVIYRVEDTVVQEHHPAAWAKRSDKIVMNMEKKVERPAEDMLAEHYKKQKASVVARKAAAEKAALKTVEHDENEDLSESPKPPKPPKP